MTRRIIVCFLAMTYMAAAQNISLTGTVTNASGGAALQGVTVSLAKTPSLSTTTKSDGTYLLQQGTSVMRILTSVAKKEPVTFETYSLNGALTGRYDRSNMSSAAQTAGLCIIKARQGTTASISPFLDLRSSFAKNIPTDISSGGMAKSAAFSDTLIFTMSGYTPARKAITSATGANNIALTPVSSGNTITDIDGNVYQTVTIGTQVWMQTNLATTKLNDGTALKYDTQGSAWGADMFNPAYGWYDNDQSKKSTYGALYNGNLIYQNGTKLAPTGWRIPSNADFATLLSTVGNSGLTSTSGFAAVLAGHREGNGTDMVAGYETEWWTTTGDSPNGCGCYTFSGGSANVSNMNNAHGFSVRCIKN